MSKKALLPHGALHRFLRRPAVAVIAVTTVLAGAGTAAANDWVQIFRTERIAAVGFDTADLVAIPDLEAYGVVEVTAELDVHRVPDAAAATAETGLHVPEVDALPQGVSGQPVYQVGSAASATLTFSADAGGTPPPPELDGARVQLDAGPGVAAIWNGGTGVPSLIVGRAVAPSVHSPDVAFETVRDHLLSLPGMPDSLAAQLEAVAAGDTLPLPVPTDSVTTTTAEVHGVTATVATTDDRTMVAVMWVENGVVTLVAGSLDSDEALAVARGLG